MNSVLVVTMEEFSAEDSEHRWVVTSEDANGKSLPFQAGLPQAEEI